MSCASIPKSRQKYTQRLGFRDLLLVFIVVMLPFEQAYCEDNGLEQSPYFEFRTLDRNFVADSIERINDLTRKHYGTALRQTKEHDIPLLQRVLDEELIRRDNLQLAQSAGVALGALLASELDLEWIRYVDDVGTSRALRVRRSEQVFFPVTMISRRYRAGITPDVHLLYKKAVERTEQARNPEAEYPYY